VWLVPRRRAQQCLFSCCHRAGRNAGAHFRVVRSEIAHSLASTLSVGATKAVSSDRRASSTAVEVTTTLPSPTLWDFIVRLRPHCLPRQTMGPALLLHAANDAAGGLQHAADADTYDEGNEVVDFGPGAIHFARMQPSGVHEVGPLVFEIESAARVARPASSNNAAPSALGSHTWTAIESATVRFIRFLALAYGVVDGAGGGDLAAQGERMVVMLDDALLFRLHRFLALLREGGRKHLGGGRSVPLSMVSVRSIATSLGYFFAFSTRDCAGKTAYVAGCGDRDEPYKSVRLADRTPAQVANGEAHCGCPLKSQVVARWLQGSKKQANILGEGSSQTPPVTADNMVVACDLGTDGVDIEDLDEPLTALQYERLTVYVIMVFCFCTTSRPENLLGLTARDVLFRPVVGENAALCL